MSIKHNAHTQLNQTTSNQRLLPDTSITNNANSHTSSQTSKTTRQASSKMRIAIKQVVRTSCCLVDCSTTQSQSLVACTYCLLHTAVVTLTSRADDNSNDQTVDTKHTSHNYWHNRLHHQLWPHHTHRSNTNARLSCAICCSKTYRRIGKADSVTEQVAIGSLSCTRIG